MSARSTTAATTAATTTTARRHRATTAAAAATAIGGAAILAAALSGAFAPAAAAAVQTNCAASLGACGYPDASTAGVPAGTTLQTVPGQVTSGPGWTYSSKTQTLSVTGAHAVLAGLSITGNVNITAAGVTLKNDKITASGDFGVSLRHTSGVTIENSTIAGTDTTTGRVASAVDDVYGDSTGAVIQNNDISAFKTGIQLSAGLITGNYLHDPGYLAGDHTNGIFVGGGTAPLTISGNTILNNLGQTDAINLDSGAAGQPVTNKTITGNYLTGGSYTIYGGASLGNTTSAITVQNNRFGQAYYPKSGQFGPGAYFNASATGSSWTGNVWDTTAQPVPAP
jgi:hypothetical protein